MIVEFKPYKNLAEIAGSFIQWSFVKQDKEKVWRALHSPFVCKDFIQDMFWAEIMGKTYDLYGFTYRNELQPILKDSFYTVAIKEQSSENHSGPFNDLDVKEENLLKFLNGFSILTKLYFKKIQTSVSDDKKTLVIRISKDVFSHPVIISLFTFLVRIGLKYKGSVSPEEFLEKGELFGNDAGYRSAAIFVLKEIKSKKFISSFKDFSSINKIHNNSGIVACLKDPAKFFNQKAVPAYEGMTYKFESQEELVQFLQTLE